MIFSSTWFIVLVAHGRASNIWHYKPTELPVTVQHHVCEACTVGGKQYNEEKTHQTRYGEEKRLGIFLHPGDTFQGIEMGTWQESSLI